MTIPEKPQGQRWFQRLAGSSLLIIAVVEGILALIFVWAITPNLYEFAGLGVVCIFAVIFKMQGRLHKWFGLWLLGAALTFTTFVSFGSTVIAKVLPAATLEEGSAVAQAKANVGSAQRALDGLRAKQVAGTYGQSTEEMTAQIKASEESLGKAQAAQRLAEAESATAKLSGLEVFSRVPALIARAVALWKSDAVAASGIWIALTFIFAMGLFIEAFMVAAVKLSQKVPTKTEGALPSVTHPIGVINPSDPAPTITVSALDGQPDISERLYIQRAWPVGQSYILAASVVADKNKWPLDICEKLETDIFGTVVRTRVPGKLVPRLQREEWIKQRSAKRRAA